MAVTIKDIAKKVGVNPSTVSRVINGTASISDETRRKIYEAMKELDYHPNSLARSLAQGSTRTIGMVLDAANTDAYSNSFFIRSMSAIEMVAQEKGYNLLIASDTTQINDHAVQDLVQGHKVDGIILPVSSATDELLDLLIRDMFPFVVMGEPNRRQDEISWVDVNNETGSAQAVEHLFGKGYRCPAMLIENHGTEFEQKRLSGFRNACRAHAVADGGMVLTCECTREGLTEAVRTLLRERPETDAIICPGNVAACYTLHALRTLGKRVPEDIGVVTFDNCPFAEYMDPSLTAVDIDTYRLGEEAIHMLFEIMQKGGQQKLKKLIPTRMIERTSTNRKEET